MNLVVFTAMFGKTDLLRPHTVWSGAASAFRCYTDNPRLKVEGWEMVVMPSEADPVRQARRTKILAHITEPDAEASLWIDAAFQLDEIPVERLKAEYKCALRHPDRATVFEEGIELVRLGLCSQAAILKQLADFRDQGFDPSQPRGWPSNAGLTSTGFLLRLHNASVKRFNECWWNAFVAGGHTRDQMSVDFAAWQAGDIPVRYLIGHYRDNPYATWSPQRTRR